MPRKYFGNLHGMPARRRLFATAYRTVALVALLESSVRPSPAAAQAAPILDGTIDDLIQFADAVRQTSGCGAVISDPHGDVRAGDLNIIPCDPTFIQGVSTYFVNGYDQTIVAVAASAGFLYLGIRVVGLIGDSDGNGDPATSCPQSTIPDRIPIGPYEMYKWYLDTGGDGGFGSSVMVSDNQVFLSGITGVAGFAFNGHDLEVQVTNANLPPVFRVYSIVAEDLSTCGEDFSAIARCGTPPNCPRPEGFWSRTCVEKGSAGPELSSARMAQVAACIDQRSTFFDWEDDTLSFRSVMTPRRPMTRRKQAERQFAALLANVCAGDLALKDADGDAIALSLDTPIDCPDFPAMTTLEDLVEGIDHQLLILAAGSESAADYRVVTRSIDRINNGTAIGPTCRTP